MSPSPPGSQASLREANQRRIVHAVAEAGVLTQAEIARATGLSAATVSNLVRGLSGTGLFEMTPTSSGGRRAQGVRLSRRAGVAVGVDFGHSHLRVAVGDLAHDVLAEDSVPLDVDSSAAEGLDRGARLIATLLDRVSATPHDVIGVGMGLPGPIDTATGVVGSSAILPGWVGVHGARGMSDRLGLDVRVDNDANLGALAEVVYGAARGHADAAYIKVATGVGGGLVIAGRIYRGAGGTAGEIGHTTIDESGQVCRCGNRGCLETLAGAPYLVDMLRQSHGPGLTLADVLDLAGSGDAGCRRVIADAGRHIGVAVANLCNLLNPDCVVVGGDLSRAGDLLLDPLREAVGRYAIPSAAQAVQVVQGSLGARAEVLGALALALREAAPAADLLRRVPSTAESG